MINFSKERDRFAIEQDCKKLFSGKYDLRRQEKALKELEKDFAKALEKDYLTQVRQSKKPGTINSPS